MIVKALLFYILFILCSYLTGSGFVVSIRRNDRFAGTVGDGLVERFTAGFVLNITAASVLSVIGSCLGISYLIILLLAGLFVIMMMALRLKNKKTADIEKANIEEGNCSRKKGICLIMAAFILLALQLSAVCVYRVNVSGNLQMLSRATIVYETGYGRGFDGLMIFWGAISKLLGIHPMSFVQSILPIVMIPMYYLVYFSLLKRMLGGKRNSALTGVIAIELMCIWGYQSIVLVPATLLLSYGVLICFAVHGLLPFVLDGIIVLQNTAPVSDDNNLSTCDNDDLQSFQEEDEIYQEEWDMKKHKIINARNLAIALGVLAVMLAAFVLVLNNKINTLHDATVNLQNDLLNRARIYEFVSATGEVDGYLIKGADGKLTMIGGGEEANADSLALFIEPYGDNITNWYLYETDDDNMGAYAKCILEKGITVENVYVLNRTQIEGIK